jgi:hypothetical protein
MKRSGRRNDRGPPSHYDAPFPVERFPRVGEAAVSATVCFNNFGLGSYEDDRDGGC